MPTAGMTKSHYSRILIISLLSVAALIFLLAGTTGPQLAAAPVTDAAPSAAGDWPMYGRDPQRTGYNPDETAISASTVGQLRRAWQVRIGLGPTGVSAFNAPSVVGDTVYVASATSEGDNLFAFDRDTGALRWSAFIGYNPDECFGVGIGSTAAISGSVITIGGGDGAYYGLSTVDGSQLWRDPLGVGPSGFAWTSPLVANGRAYVGVASDCDNPSVRGELRSLNLSNGGHLGSAYIVPEGEAGGGIWNSPVLSPDGSKVVVATGEDYEGFNGPLNRAMVVLDADTLGVLASNQQGTPDVDQDWAATPVIFRDSTGRVLVGANHKNATFYAYDLNDVSAGPVWSWQSGLMTGTPPAYDPTFGNGGSLIFALRGRLYFLDPANGAIRQISDYFGSTAHGIAVANGLAYVNSQGTLFILEEASGHILRTIAPPLHGTSFGGPVVSNGMVFWTSGEYVNAWHLGPPPTPSPTLEPGVTPVPPPCPNEYFTDVCPGTYYYEPVYSLNLDGIISGYETSPPCENSLWVPCFKPFNTSTRGQIAKIVSLAAGFNEPVSGQQFEDVLPGSTFHEYIARLYSRDIVSGYPCGGPSEPCGLGSLPYFRPGNDVTRGQLSKMAAISFGWSDPVTGRQFEDVPPGSAFHEYIGRLYGRGIISGYPCGGPNEACGPGNLPYFRPGNDVTRSQTVKIVELARTQPAVTGTPTPIPQATSTLTPTPASTAKAAATGTPAAALR